MNSADLSIADIQLKETVFSVDVLPTGIPASLKENFLKSNPLGTLVRSGTNLYKNYPLGKEYPILDVQVYIYPDKTTSFSVLLKGDNNKTTWKNLKKFKN